MSEYLNDSRNYSSMYQKDGKLFVKDSDSETKEVRQNVFPSDEWDCVEAFNFAKIKGYDPMLAKEIPEQEKQDELMNDSNYILEEKFDGTRAIVQFFSQTDVEGKKNGYCRVFSRRISAKTGFFVENSDLLPQIRDINIPELEGTVIDGEMFINGRPFKDVSSTLNCVSEKAIARQLEIGFITLHTFDILRYKGIDIRRMPLYKRKQYLEKVIKTLKDNKYKWIELVPYFTCGKELLHNNEALNVEAIIRFRLKDTNYKGKFNPDSFPSLVESIKSECLTPRAFYELIVATDGEGVILKPRDGIYKCGKRQNEYLKIKKFFTREVIITGFTEPTKEYEGKFVKNRWSYWLSNDGKEERVSVDTYSQLPADELLRRGFIPVTRFYYYQMIGNIKYGVLINDFEIEKLPKNKKFDIHDITLPCGSTVKVIEVGDCGGIDDNMKNYFSYTRVTKEGEEFSIAPWEEEANVKLVKNSRKKSFVGTVVEVKCNELFRDTGKMRHPRFMRIRDDKSAFSCTWSEHIL